MNTRNDSCEIPLALAALIGNYSAVVHDISNVKVNNLIYTTFKLRNQSSIQRLSSWSGLHVARVENDVSAVTKLLNSQSVKDIINLSTWVGCTPLHLAVQERNADIVKLLVDSGADIAAKDVRETTALYLAFEKDKDSIIHMILVAHANLGVNPIDSVGLSHGHIACTGNVLNILRDFSKGGIGGNSRLSSELAFRPGNAGLHLACISLQMDVIEVLLDHGADIGARNELGFTTLESAIKEYGNDYYQHMGANIMLVFLVSRIFTWPVPEAT